MKLFVMAVALTGVISVTALAGNIPTGDFVPPPPPPAPTSNSSNTPLNTVVVNLILTITTLIGR